MIKKRVALFCDVPGLWWSANRFSKGRIDYPKLRAEVSNPNRIVHSAAAYLADRDGLDRFLSALKHCGYDTTVVPRGNDIDTLIVSAVLQIADSVDVIAIAASNGRYAALGEQLAAQNKELELWGFPIPCALATEMSGKARWNDLGSGVLLAS